MASVKMETTIIITEAVTKPTEGESPVTYK